MNERGVGVVGETARASARANAFAQRTVATVKAAGARSHPLGGAAALSASAQPLSSRLQMRRGAAPYAPASRRARGWQLRPEQRARTWASAAPRSLRHVEGAALLARGPLASSVAAAGAPPAAGSAQSHSSPLLHSISSARGAPSRTSAAAASPSPSQLDGTTAAA
eukprot:7376682-Prymnesium_polylepis.1